MGLNFPMALIYVSYSPHKAVPSLRLLVAGFEQCWRGLEPRSVHVGFVVDKTAMEYIFSEYFSSSVKHSIDCPTLIIIHHLGLVQVAI
jgi:hypothetical protein